jgi:hypothetical protein
MGRAVDQLAGNDPDLPFTWPINDIGDVGQWDIFRYDAGIMLDPAGDPTGNGSNAVLADLQAMGYRTTQYIAPVPIAAIGMHDVLIWAADGPHGVLAPYEWIEPADLTTMMQFVDRGSSLVILGPPAFDDAGQPFQDPTFNISYQPFFTTNSDTGGNTDLTPVGFTSVNDFVVTSCGYSGAWGNNLLLPFLAGSTDQVMRNVSGNDFRVAGMRPGPNGGNTYVGMFTFPSIGAITPAGATRAHLLDNIVAGSIQRQ